MEIADKNAIITGGASGLGAATAKLLAQRGAKVGIFDIDEQQGRAVAADCVGHFFRVDVANRAQVDAGLSDFEHSISYPRILVNCAGVAPGIRTLQANATRYPFEAFEHTIKVNLIGTAYMAICFASLCRGEGEDEDNGVIINTASIAAFDGQVGHVPYAASKAGVVGMTLPLARDLADARIRVVTIAPGLFDTPMLDGIPNPNGFALGKQVPHPSRLGRPEEFARMVEAIISNPMLNGETIRLDGALRLAAY